MAESARHLVEEVFGPRPVRQWVLSVPVPLRFLFASKPETIGPVLGIVHRVIAGWLADQVSRRWCRHRAPTSPAFHGVFAPNANLRAQPQRKAPLDDLGAAPQARFQHRREHVRPLRRRSADRGQHRRTHRHPRHPRPLRKARRAGKSALPTRPARTARCGRVTPRRPRRRRRNKARPHEAATIPQGRARPAVGNQREMATDGEASRARAAEIPRANVRSAPKLALARPPATRQTVRKGRL